MAVRRRDIDRQRDAVLLNGELDLDTADLLAAIDATLKAAWRRATRSTVDDHGTWFRRIATGAPPGAASGSRASLPKPSPLRTGRDDCSSSGSSLSRAVRGTEGAAPATTCASIAGHAHWFVRCQASSNVSNGSCRSVASLPPRPVGSLHPFGLGISRSRRPYLPRYKTAFAFSDSPLPPPSSPFLAVGTPPCSGTNGAYPVVQCGDADGGVASCSPAGHGATVVDGYNRRADPPAILAPACQHFWPVLDDGP